ncbi:MAG: flippase [bacterium]|nr:flippase [bacterium]
MAVARKIAYNVFFNATAKILSTVLALVSIGFITRYLGKDGFGNYATVLAFFSFFGSMADLGLYSIATREISRAGADEKKIMGNAFSLRLFSALIVFILSPLVLFLPYSHELKTGIIIASASFIFSSSYSVLNGIFQKYLAMDKVAITELIGKIIQLVIVVAAVKMNLGFSMVILSLLAYMIFNFVVVLILSRRYVKFKIEIDFSYWKKFLKESLPMGIAVVISFLYFKMDTILLSIMKSSSDVGIYNAAYKVLENITFFPAMMIGLILPLTSRYIFTDKEKFNQISNKIFKIFLILVIPVVIGALFLSNGIIRLIGGGGFAESANVLRILVFALAFIFFGNFFNNILLSGNLQKKMMIVLAFCAVFNISLNFLLIPKYSYFGSAYISVATEMLVVFFGFYLSRKYLKYTPRIKNIGSLFVSGLAMSIFLFFLSGTNFFILALGSVAIYLIFLYLTKAINQDEIRSIFNREKIQVEEIFPEETIG